MACPVVQTTGTASTAASTATGYVVVPVVDQVSAARDRAYSDAASKASLECQQQSGFQCKYYAYAGIVSMTVTEQGSTASPSGPTYVNRKARVDLTVRWQCEQNNPVASASVLDAAKRQACGQQFTITVTAMDHDNGPAATARAKEIAQAQAEKTCAELPCDVLQKISESLTGATQDPTTNRWLDTCTATFQCNMRTP